MSRINVRYYKAHPPKKERELSPAAYFAWHSMTPQQRENLMQWSKDFTTAMINLADQLNTAMLEAFREVGLQLQKEIQRINSVNSP